MAKMNIKRGDKVKVLSGKDKGVEGNVMRLVHRLYYKENGKWVEKTTVREIDESEVPEWAKAGLTAKEQDVGARYEKELELSV